MLPLMISFCFDKFPVAYKIKQMTQLHQGPVVSATASVLVGIEFESRLDLTNTL